MPKRSPLQVADAQVEIRLKDERLLSVRPSLVHERQERYYGFADVEKFSDSGILHTVTVVLTRDEVEDELRDQPRTGSSPAVTWQDLEIYTTEHTREQFARGELVVARLDVEEFPARIRYQMRTSWCMWLDAIDGDTAEAGAVADQIREAEDSLALIDGSLFYIRGLSVHPAFQGQRLGARLLAHTLWAMQRSTGDTAILLAKPVQNIFAPDDPACGVEEIRRLVQYYRRLGFTRADPRAPIRPDEPVAMYALFGESRLPFRGIGELGLD